MKTQTYFGFTNANASDEPAWFHSQEAAERFAIACGWENASVETTDEPAPGSVMDTPETPWTHTPPPARVKIGETIQINSLPYTVVEHLSDGDILRGGDNHFYEWRKGQANPVRVNIDSSGT